jgi:hypothetical protein
MKRLAPGIFVFLVCASIGAAGSAVRQRVFRNIIVVPQGAMRAYRQGLDEAKLDLAQGHLRYRTYGMPTEWEGPDLYAEHLRNDYNIELVTVAGCVVTQDLIDRTRGYDNTSLRVIEARYGTGILDRVHEQAVDEWKQKHKSR